MALETELSWFEVRGNFKAVIADEPTDTDAIPDIVPVQATVTFTPLLAAGDVILASQVSPPTALIGAPIQAIIDTDGVLKLRPDADVRAGQPIMLLADSPLLELAEPLFYLVTFTQVRFYNKPATINSFTFQAPNSDGQIVDLVTVMRQPGQLASGITKIAPGGVRMENDALVFSFDNVDIPDPVDMSHISGPTGPQGPTGPAGPEGPPGEGLTISGELPTWADLPALGPDDAGTAYLIDGLLYVWSGTSWPAEGEGSEFRGPQGDPGPEGPAGQAATITVGTVTTGAAGSDATITNRGDSTEAVFDFTIPRGDTGSASGETWDTLAGKPAVIAAGATVVEALAVIGAETVTAKAQPNGYASLNADGRVPAAQMGGVVSPVVDGGTPESSTTDTIDGGTP